MHFINDIQDINSALKKYNGGTAQIYMFSLSLRRIAIKLETSKISEIGFLIGAGCKHIVGNFDWENINLVVINRKISESNDDVIEVMDKSSGFNLIVIGGVTLAIGLLHEFGNSFENFLNHKIN